jgi:hypothetical protein
MRIFSHCYVLLLLLNSFNLKSQPLRYLRIKITKGIKGVWEWNIIKNQQNEKNTFSTIIYSAFQP